MKNNLNPDWKTAIVVQYFFEKVQILTFKVADSDGGETTGDDKEMIGTVKITLAEIMGARAQCLETQLTHNGKKTGKLIVRAEASSNSNEVIDMDCEWNSLNRKYGCICTEVTPVFMRISRPRPNNPSEYIIGAARIEENWRKHKEQTAYFPRQTVRLAAICDADRDLPMKISIHFKKENEKEITNITCSVNDILNKKEIRNP